MNLSLPRDIRNDDIKYLHLMNDATSATPHVHSTTTLPPNSNSLRAWRYFETLYDTAAGYCVICSRLVGTLERLHRYGELGSLHHHVR